MNPFGVLGVPHTADDAALKRAYFKKLREHPPETDPKKFQEVQEAFEILRDPARRRAAMRPEVPERLRELLRSAMSTLDARQALTLLKRAVAEFPDHVPAHVMHASCLARIDAADGLTAARALSTRFPNDVEVQLLHATLETASGPRREALRRAWEIAPGDRRPLYLDAKELVTLRRFDEAMKAIELAQAIPDESDVSNAQLAGARLLVRMEKGEALKLDDATPELCSTLVSLAATMIQTNRNVYARTLLDKVHALDPKRPPIPFGPSVHIPLDRLPKATREAVEHNAHSPSRRTVNITTPPKTKKWVQKPAWWVELRDLHLIVRRANGVQVCPILSLQLQQRAADVPLLTCHGADAGLEGMTELAWLFEVAMEQKQRLLDLMSRDLLETEQQREPLTWTLSSNA